MPGLTRHLIENESKKRYRIKVYPGPDPGPGMTINDFFDRFLVFQIKSSFCYRNGLGSIQCILSIELKGS
jgi:hypothetical protein